MKLRQMLGRAVTPEENTVLRERYPDGVMEDQLNEVRDLLEGKIIAPPRLVAVS
jgi:hypothetical protein